MSDDSWQLTWQLKYLYTDSNCPHSSLRPVLNSWDCPVRVAANLSISARSDLHLHHMVCCIGNMSCQVSQIRSVKSPPQNI